MGPVLTTPPLLNRRSDAGSRRLVRTVPGGTSAALVVHLIRTAMQPGWTPAAASTAVVTYAQGDLALLRLTRLRLRQSTRFRSTLAEARALATVNLAISSLEDEVSNQRRLRDLDLTS
jgi:hypothetical protein